MNYTKGPWKLEGSHIYAPAPANVRPHLAKVIYGGHEDARLISAAPDMYEALKQAYTLIGEDLIDNSIDEKYTELHNLIGKAIEKAEGGNEE